MMGIKLITMSFLFVVGNRPSFYQLYHDQTPLALVMHSKHVHVFAGTLVKMYTRSKLYSYTDFYNDSVL